MAHVAQLEVGIGPLGEIGDTERKRCAQALGGLVEGQRRDRRAGGEQVVRDRALRASDRGSGGKVMSERGHAGSLVRERLAALERLGHAEVDLGAARSREAVDHGPAHQLVCEAVREAPRRHLDHETAPLRLVDGVEKRALLERRGPTQRVELELCARDRRELEHGGGRGIEPSQALAHDGAYRVRRTELRCRARELKDPVGGVDRAAVQQLAPELREEERIAGGEAPRTNSAISSRLRPLRRTRTTPSVRPTSTSVSDSSSATSAPESR